ncbi:MAG: SsrA-binding protein SmpB [Elusimicrobiota bacterium]
MMEKKVVATNRGLTRQYELIEDYEAGMVLLGSEVKSLRAGTVNIRDSYCTVERGEIFIHNMYISPYKQSGFFSPQPKRKRKLLLHKKQINRIFGRMTQKGFAAVPGELYFNPEGIAKLKIYLVKKKQGPDKREKIIKRETERELQKQEIWRGSDGDILERWVSG